MEKRQRKQSYVPLKLAAFVLQGTVCMTKTRIMAYSVCLSVLHWNLFFILPINHTVQLADCNPPHRSCPQFYYLYLLIDILYISTKIKTMSVIKMIILMYWIQISRYSLLVQNVCILPRHSLLGFELLKHNNKQVEK